MTANALPRPSSTRKHNFFKYLVISTIESMVLRLKKPAWAPKIIPRRPPKRKTWPKYTSEGFPGLTRALAQEVGRAQITADNCR